MWEGCYESGDPYLGTAEDIETSVGWTGDRGALVSALLDAGAPLHAGFIDRLVGEGEPTYAVHDLWHHVPDYVKKRHKRETERRQRDTPTAGRRRKSDKRRRTAPNGGQRPPSTDSQDGDGQPPSPSPSPSPIDQDQDQRAGARDTHRVLVRLSHEVLGLVDDGRLPSAEVKDELKLRAAKAAIDYDARAVTKALDSAEAQRAADRRGPA